jgi:hypothetical protein
LCNKLYVLKKISFDVSSFSKKSLNISSIKSHFNSKSIVFFVLKDISSPSADRLVSSSSKETSSDMLAFHYNQYTD